MQMKTPKVTELAKGEEKIRIQICIQRKNEHPKCTPPGGILGTAVKANFIVRLLLQRSEDRLRLGLIQGSHDDVEAGVTRRQTQTAERKLVPGVEIFCQTHVFDVFCTLWCACCWFFFKLPN
jgi:hypothetical protein